MREEISQYLQNKNFRLEQVHPKLPHFLILEFPDIERRISPAGEFAIASELVDILGLRSAIPDGSKPFPIRMDEVDQDIEESEGQFGEAYLDRNCWSKTDPSLNKEWVREFLNLTKIDNNILGHGITIAQPDTGVAAHKEIDGKVDIKRAYNVFKRQNCRRYRPFVVRRSYTGGMVLQRVVSYVVITRLRFLVLLQAHLLFLFGALIPSYSNLMEQMWQKQ